ncbi:MAG: hypothetical protein M1815_004025 [Lichina confinis]|nr:MAG: hypothetical protein M1815_004025 [Lichina confinis]
MRVNARSPPPTMRPAGNAPNALTSSTMTPGMDEKPTCRHRFNKLATGFGPGAAQSLRMRALVGPIPNGIVPSENSLDLAVEVVGSPHLTTIILALPIIVGQQPSKIFVVADQA